MKKKILLISAITITILNTRAQGLYIGVKAGYGLGIATGQVGTDYNSDSENYATSNSNGTSDFTQSFTQKRIQGSYGQGFTPSLQVGYMFTKYIGAELNFSYLIGNKFQSNNNSISNTYDTLNILTSKDNNNTITKTGVTSFYINPALVIRLPMESKIVPYAKIGLYVGLINNLKSDITLSSSDVSYQENTNSFNTSGSGSGSSTGKLNLGVTAALGVDYMLTKSFALFGEINIISASISLKDYTYNETSTNSSLGATYNNSSSTTYSDENTTTYASGSESSSTTKPIAGPDIVSGNTTVTTNPNGTTETITNIYYKNGTSSHSNVSAGNKQLAQTIPLSSIGLTIGARFFFGK